MHTIDYYKYGNDYSNLIKAYAFSTPTYSPYTAWADYGIYGYGGNDVLVGSHGDDFLFGGLGNDTLIGGYGFNYLDGGTGYDTVDYSFYGNNTSVAATSGVYVNLSTGEAFNRATGPLVDDQLVSIEAVVGSNRADYIVGNLNGNILEGGAGKDYINGAGGADDIYGDGGADVLTGGSADDYFIYDFVSDSSVATGRDTITDFTLGLDTIDLSGIDASTLSIGNQAFHWVGNDSSFSGVAGELHYRYSGTTTIVEGDVNGNGLADFAIVLNGIKPLIESDFIL